MSNERRRVVAGIVRSVLFTSAICALLAPLEGTFSPVLRAQEVAPAKSTGGLTVTPGDLLDVEVLNTPELSGKFRVSQTGSISLAQGGAISLNGLSAIEAGSAIEQRLRSAQIMLDPHVTVFVQEYASQGVIVVGEVNRPGTYTLLGEHSLYGALAAAGGPTPNEGRTITITHENEPDKPVVIESRGTRFSDVERSTRVEPGDTVFVSKTGIYYVVGNVERPGGFPLPAGEEVTVLAAIALAQGIQRATAESKVSIIRDTPNGIISIPLDYRKISENKAPNPVLQARDILVIPRSGFKAILDTTIPYASSSLIAAVTSALIVR